VSSLQELVESRAGLYGAAVDTLQVITSDWQILADLSFADLVMFCRNPDTWELTVIAQMRPYTAQTVYHEDLVGRTIDELDEDLPAGVIIALVGRDGDNQVPDADFTLQDGDHLTFLGRKDAVREALEWCHPENA